MNPNDDKLTLQRFIDAFTKEDSALNFPVKYPAIDLDKATKQSLYFTAGILAAGMIGAALIVRSKNAKR